MDGDVSLTNVTIAGNAGVSGSAIFNAAGSLVVTVAQSGTPSLTLVLGGTAEKAASERVDVALVAAYTPVCVAKFVGPADDAKWEEFAKVECWRRDDYVKKAGLAIISEIGLP